MTRYELLERIGSGGMAEIFRGRATAIGGFEKPVAIKKILPHLGRDSRFVKMLIAEAKLLASLRHRNIVNIYDVGLGEDGEYFLVMEFVEGTDLGALVERMERDAIRFPLDLALFLGSEVCEALDHAHGARGPDGKPLGLVHRDVSPSNVLLSFSGEIKLTDFGIAKPVDEASVVATIKGKFAYMSPEQARAGALDQTSDLYSLGVLLYELTTGRRLFSGAQNDMEAFRLVREARIPRPREVDPSYSRDLEAILLKALAAHPRQRYQSAAAFGAALRDFRYSAATSAGDPAKDIANLARRFFPQASARSEKSTVVRIRTVAGFPVHENGSASGELDDAATTVASVAGLRAGDVLAARAPSPAPAPAAVRARGDDDPLARLLDAAPVDPDAQTRMVDARGRGARVASTVPGTPEAQQRRREATPTVRDAFPGAMVFDDGVLPTAEVSPIPSDVELLRAGKRRSLYWAIALIVIALLGAGAAFLFHTRMGPGTGDDDNGDVHPARPSTNAGEALDAPTIDPPVKPRRK